MINIRRKLVTNHPKCNQAPLQRFDVRRDGYNLARGNRQPRLSLQHAVMTSTLFGLLQVARNHRNQPRTTWRYCYATTMRAWNPARGKNVVQDRSTYTCARWSGYSLAAPHPCQAWLPLSASQTCQRKPAIHALARLATGSSPTTHLHVVPFEVGCW